jgi:hypothetical protein
MVFFLLATLVPAWRVQLFPRTPLFVARSLTQDLLSLVILDFQSNKIKYETRQDPGLIENCKLLIERKNAILQGFDSFQSSLRTATWVLSSTSLSWPLSTLLADSGTTILSSCKETNILCSNPIPCSSFGWAIRLAFKS